MGNRLTNTTVAQGEVGVDAVNYLISTSSQKPIQ